MLTGNPMSAALPNEVLFEILAYYFKTDAMHEFNNFELVCCAPADTTRPLMPAVYGVCSRWRKELLRNPNLYWDDSDHIFVGGRGGCSPSDRPCGGDPERQLKRLKSRLTWTRTIPIRFEICIEYGEAQEIARLQEKLILIFREVKPMFRGIHEGIRDGGIFYSLLREMDASQFENITALGLQRPWDPDWPGIPDYWLDKFRLPKLRSFILDCDEADLTCVLESLECPDLKSLVVVQEPNPEISVEQLLNSAVSRFPNLEHIGFPVTFSTGSENLSLQVSRIQNLTLSDLPYTDSPFEAALPFFPNVTRITSLTFGSILQTINHDIWGNICSLHIATTLHPDLEDSKIAMKNEWEEIARRMPRLAELVLGTFIFDSVDAERHSAHQVSNSWLIRGWNTGHFDSASVDQLFELLPVRSKEGEGNFEFWPGLKHLAIGLSMWPRAFSNLHEGFNLRHLLTPGSFTLSLQGVNVTYDDDDSSPFWLDDVTKVSFDQFDTQNVVKWVPLPWQVVNHQRKHTPREGIER